MEARDVGGFWREFNMVAKIFAGWKQLKTAVSASVESEG